MLRRPLLRLRERMVLGQLRSHLDEDEAITAWVHVVGSDGRPGVMTVTSKRCLVHTAPPDRPPTVIDASELTDWNVEPLRDTTAELYLNGSTDPVTIRLPLTTHGQARKATEVVGQLARWTPVDGADAPPVLTSRQLGMRGHVRRVLVTVVGVVVILISALFASPFFPGPGALTFLAGLAILAREYDWARDVHAWVRRRFEQLWAWLKRRREQRRARRAASQQP